jgi:A/G-specific adenine glycosylase
LRPLRAAGPAAAVSAALLAWYRRAQRDLPWRREPSPYKTLVSELMLQQTGVSVVIPYFHRWLVRFPDLATLAAAPEGEVTAAWSGLGYYARARNLQRAARTVVAEHGGVLPSDETALRALPGVGPYTAAAIAAIAFGRRAFALDGNAVRVVARLCGVEAPVNTPDMRARLTAAGLAWVPSRGSGDFVQAVMELGATVCRPRTPDCGRCPVAHLCRAARRGCAEAIPAKTERAPKLRVRWAALRAWSRGKVALGLRASGLLAGTFLPPVVALPAEGAQEDADADADDKAGPGPAAPGWGALLAAPPAPAPRFVGTIRHVLTHRDLTVDLFECEVARRSELGAAPAGGWRWVSPVDAGGLALSSLGRKLLAR